MAEAGPLSVLSHHKIQEMTPAGPRPRFCFRGRTLALSRVEGASGSHGLLSCFCVSLLLVFASCALKTKQANLFEGNKAGHFLCGDASAKKLGVAAFFDSRPKVERTGKKANGTYLLLWNQRKGDYVTGDKDFTDFSPRKFAELSSQYIAKSNCFIEAKVLGTSLPPQPSSSDFLVALANDKVDYVLTGDIQHLYGTQYQNSGVVVVPAIFVNAAGTRNVVGDAEGMVEILFTLYDVKTGGEVWRELVRGTSSSSVQGNYAGVVKEALDDANVRLAEQIFKFVSHK